MPSNTLLRRIAAYVVLSISLLSHVRTLHVFVGCKFYGRGGLDL